MSATFPRRLRLRDRRIGQRLRGHPGVLPGAITLGNMLCGFAAILLASRGQFLYAAWLIVAAFFLDGIDGRVARLVGAAGRFGEQLDALADTVSFAVAPAALSFHMGLGDLGRPGWGACFLFAACGVLRLARFNAAPVHDIRYFIGLPIPTAAAIAAAPAFLLAGAPFPARPWAWLHAAVVAITAILMVSRIRFRTGKDLRFGPKPYRQLALFATVAIAFVLWFEWALVVWLVGYLLSPLVDGLRVRRQEQISGPPPGSGALAREFEPDSDRGAPTA